MDIQFQPAETILAHKTVGIPVWKTRYPSWFQANLADYAELVVAGRLQGYPSWSFFPLEIAPEKLARRLCLWVLLFLQSHPKSCSQYSTGKAAFRHQSVFCRTSSVWSGRKQYLLNTKQKLIQDKGNTYKSQICDQCFACVYLYKDHSQTSKLILGTYDLSVQSIFSIFGGTTTPSRQAICIILYLTHFWCVSFISLWKNCVVKARGFAKHIF